MRGHGPACGIRIPVRDALQDGEVFLDGFFGDRGVVAQPEKMHVGMQGVQRVPQQFIVADPGDMRVELPIQHGILECMEAKYIATIEGDGIGLGSPGPPCRCSAL